MKKIIFAVLLGSLAAACNTTDQRIAGAAAGAGTGALIGGPIGAIAGGAIGAVAAPTVTGSINRARQ
jgi:osmotically inducible lipoprotein OsmB